MLAKMNRTYPGIFDDFFGMDHYPAHYRRNGFKTLPAVNISEGENEFTIEVAAPGLEKKDFKINLDNNCLTIASVREDNKEEVMDQYTRREFGYASFQRTFVLPESVDGEKIKANYADGILNVQLPKKEEAKPKPARTIKVS